MDTPPIHRVDAEPRYIQTEDPAFKAGYERGAKEWQAIRESDGPEKAAAHPVAQYVSGRSRFDIQTIREYLDGEPVQWVLKILPLPVYAGLKDLVERSGEYTGHLHALKVGLRRIEGPTKLASIDTAGRDALTDRELEQIAAAFEPDVLFEVGRAVLRANEHMRGNEGKR
jgi:hypothetical protein